MKHQRLRGGVGISSRICPCTSSHIEPSKASLYSLVIEDGSQCQLVLRRERGVFYEEALVNMRQLSCEKLGNLFGRRNFAKSVPDRNLHARGGVFFVIVA